jgi:TRAP-type C4-dicarboxylate transport system permease small subunit
LVFIYFSPFLYASQSILNLQDDLVTTLISLSFSLVVSFVLMALYNVQDYIENPFDQKGLDDLKIDLLKVNEYESLHSK